MDELTRVPRGREPRGAAATRAAWTRLSRAAGGRRLRERATGGKGVPFLAAVVVAASVFAAAACGETEQARAGAAVADPESGQKTGDQESTPAAEAVAGGDGSNPAAAKAGDVEARADGTGDAKAGTGWAAAQAGGVRITGNGPEDLGGTTEGRDGTQEVTLTITGNPGTRFAGSCSIGGEERTLKGEAPKRYAFEPRDKKFECEVRKEGGGTLSIVFADGGSVWSEQRTVAGGSAMRFVYSGGGIASSSSSVTVEQSATSSDGSPSGGPE